MVDIMSDTRAAKAPWHLWVVGIIAILFNGIGVFDYLMSKTQGAAYLQGAGMSQAQIEHYMNLPFWMSAVWAIGVWGAFLASILLLLRNKLATPVFMVSLAAFVLSLVYHYGIAGAGDLMGTAGIVSNAVISVLLVLFILYARAMGKRGVLR